MKNKHKRRRQRLSDSKTVAVSRLFSTRRPTQQVIDQSVTTLIHNQQIYSTFLTGATLNLILYCPLLLFLLPHLISSSACYFVLNSSSAMISSG